MAEIPDVAPGGDVESLWGNAIRDRALMRYASEAVRDASEPSPAEGTLAYLVDQDRITYWNGTIWAVILPEDFAALTYLPLAGGIITGDLQVNGEIQADGGIEPGAWQFVSLLNGWTNFGSSFQTARYKKNSDGVVEIQGMIDDGTITDGTPMFILQAGYRPNADLIMVVRNQEGAARITIRSNGEVQTGTGFISAGIWTSLQMTFSVG